MPAWSGIGKPYDPVSQTGVIGKNYCYQTGAGANLFFEGRNFNPFMNAGGSNATMDDFNLNDAFDRGPFGFVGGYSIGAGFNTALPIDHRPVPRGTPQWGTAWKAATAKWYQTAMNIGASGGVMAFDPADPALATAAVDTDGDVVVVGGRYGVRIREVATAAERVRTMEVVFP